MKSTGDLFRRKNSRAGGTRYGCTAFCPRAVGSARGLPADIEQLQEEVIVIWIAVALAP